MRKKELEFCEGHHMRKLKLQHNHKYQIKWLIYFSKDSYCSVKFTLKPHLKPNFEKPKQLDS